MTPPVVSGSSQTADSGNVLALRDFHPFDAYGARFLYMVPSAGIFRMDDCGSAILDVLAEGPLDHDALVEALNDRFDLVRCLGDGRSQHVWSTLGAQDVILDADAPHVCEAVSYTHLTLPTKRIV